MTHAIDALAAWRLTRLVTEDRATDGVRDALDRRLGPDHPAAYLAGCPHCVGVWAAATTTAARRLAPRAWAPVATMLATAAVVSLIHEAREAVA